MDINDLKTMIGRRIFELRKNNNYSKKDVREKTDISEQMQKQYEDGSVKKIPSTEILLKLSELYQVPISYFFSDAYDTPAKTDKHQINGIFEVAKTLIDLSQAHGVSLFIEKRTETTDVPCGTIEYPRFEPEPYSVFSFTITDKPIIYNMLKKDTCDYSNLKLYENSILNQFLDKLLTYINLYHENKIDIDDYNTLCEKALKIVKESEEELLEWDGFGETDNLPF
ncbi:MAG: helix-turn-helix domain-containing protein [Hominilimicola sp.]